VQVDDAFVAIHAAIMRQRAGGVVAWPQAAPRRVFRDNPSIGPTMTRSRLAGSTALLCAALLLGLPACKPSPPAAEATPSQAPVGVAADKATAAAVIPAGDPRDEVVAAMRKFMAVRSFHANMRTDGDARGASEMEFVAPDRFRMRMPGMPEQLVIGNTMHMAVDGRRMQVPLPAGSAAKWRNPANFSETEATITADSLGTDTVDGQLARKYLVRQQQPEPLETTLWIGGDGLPLQLQASGNANGKPFLTTIRYSRYNDPTLRIEAPK
jgi:hypothetical protein